MGGFPKHTYGSEELTFRTFSTETSPVGSKMVIEDGRTFRFANCGGTAAVSARVFQSIVPSANGLTEDLDTLEAGATSLTGVGATSAGFAVGLFNDGYAVIDEVAQLDPIHQIRKQTNVITTGTVGIFTLKSELVDAVAIGEKISYIENPWRDIIVTPSTGPTNFPCGVIVVAIAADEFGWVATSGVTRVLQDSTHIVGEGTMCSEAIAGAVEKWVPDTDQGSLEIESMPMGPCVAAESTNEKSLIWLRYIE